MLSEMRPGALLLAITVAFATVTASGAAHADPARDSSRVEFSRGVALVKQGNYRAAREAFADAYRLYPHPSILLNLGIAQWKTGQFVEAESSLVKFLADYGDASAANVESARAALREIRAHLGSIRLTVTTPDAKVTFDGRNIPVIPNMEVAVAGLVGDHDLLVQANGYTPHRAHLHLDAGAIKPITVTLVSEAPEPAPAAVATVPANGAAPKADESSGHGRVVAGWTLFGVGAASAIAGTICGVRAISLANDYNHHGFAPADKSNGTTFRTLSDVTFAAAIVTGGIGITLLLTGSGSSSAPSTALGIGPTSLSLRQTF